MKLTFSTKNVNRPTFLDLCQYAYDYGFSGFEIYDAVKERKQHHDSVLRSDRVADAKRKLLNRSLAVSALVYPYPIDSYDAMGEEILKYVNMADQASVERVIVRIENKTENSVLEEKLSDAIKRAEKAGVEILLETSGYLSATENVIDVINLFSSAALGASWNIRETYFGAGESAETTIKNLGAYIKYVRLGDMKDGKTVLIGEGTLPVHEFVNALTSLNFDGFVSVAWNEEINDADIVLTHFANYIANLSREKKEFDHAYYNRAKTGTFVWKKYDVIDKTFSEVLDTMVENYPDQYAFKYTTLDYTRTYAEFRHDVDKTAAALISLGVKAGSHVALWATNIPEWYITFWATVKIGAVLVTVNTAYKVYEAEYRELPEIKMMYARRSNFFRFTNITDVENVSFCWQVEEKLKRHWEKVCVVDNQDTNVFEHIFEKGKDYRVTAFIRSDDGGCSTRVVAEITACDLEMPRII